MPSSATFGSTQSKWQPTYQSRLLIAALFVESENQIVVMDYDSLALNELVCLDKIPVEATSSELILVINYAQDSVKGAGGDGDDDDDDGI